MLISYLRKIIALILSSFTALFAVRTGKTVPVYISPEEATALINDIAGDSPLSESVLLAKRLSNGVQAAYTDADRTAYRIVNKNMTLTHTLGKYKNGATLTDAEGNVYIENSFDAWCRDTLGGVYCSSVSSAQGRVNTIRLGTYYYETHVRDYDLKPTAFKLDKAFHVYADKLYLQYTLLADKATEKLDSFGAEIRIPADTVAAVQIKDGHGFHNYAVKTAEDAEYAAFDIKNVGTVGFIVPADGSVKGLSVRLSGGYYILTLTAAYGRGTGINKYDETGGYALNSVTMGCRVYTDRTHNFGGVEREAAIERRPLAISCDTGADVTYEALRGCYTVSLPGTHFQAAYDAPDTRFSAGLRVAADEYDREIFIRATTGSGCLEAGAVLDGNGAPVPICVEVCKNFSGDGGEEYYSAKDRSYGDAFFPLYVKAGEPLQATAVHLYQNWGKYPLKQLSSIEFFVSYYHLSTGTTESNCIAPYYVYGKDGWTLPDFRGRSGVMWSTQPQFNSVGELRFMVDREGTKQAYGEFAGNVIRSVGQSYSDVEMTYYSSDGKYRYTLRHAEFPSTDENRTFYTVKIEFLADKTYSDFRGSVDLFNINGRFVRFDYLGYLGADGDDRTAVIDPAAGTQYYVLGSEQPYFSLTHVTEDTQSYLEQYFGSNAALLLRGSEIVMSGEKREIPFALRNVSNAEKTEVSLTLDAGKLTFRKGDTITLDLILLPWGTGLETGCANVIAVREDSCRNRLAVTAHTGKTVADPVLPTVRCDGNTAEFTVTGGKNNTPVRIDGFTRFGRLCVEENISGVWTPVALASSFGYDGYGIYYNADGTYGYSFVYESDGSARTFRVTVE